MPTGQYKKHTAASRRISPRELRTFFHGEGVLLGVATSSPVSQGSFAPRPCPAGRKWVFAGRTQVEQIFFSSTGRVSMWEQPRVNGDR